MKSYEESAWEAAPEAAWRAAWDAELAAADPWISRELVLVGGLFAAHLVQPAWQGRVGPPAEGAGRRRWLGRVLEPAEVPQLKIALGLTDAARAFADGAATAALVLRDGVSLSLASGLWLRRARVMDRQRLEVVGAGPQRAAFTALGCFVEVIAYTPRVFVPVDQPKVLTAILGKWPVQTVLPAAA